MMLRAREGARIADSSEVGPLGDSQVCRTIPITDRCSFGASITDHGLNPMSDTKHLLRDLHNLLLKIRDLRRAIDQGPRQLRAQRTAMEAQQKKLQDAQDGLKHFK